MLIPASHKASLPHPQIIGRTEALAKPGATADNVPGAAHTDEVTAAVEMFMEAGDALLFSDATVSGPALLPLRARARWLELRKTGAVCWFAVRCAAVPPLGVSQRPRALLQQAPDQAPEPEPAGALGRVAVELAPVQQKRQKLQQPHAVNLS